MAFDPTQPADGSALVKAPIRANFEALDNMAGTLPEDWENSKGRPLVGSQTVRGAREKYGPVPASPTDPMQLGGAPLGGHATAFATAVTDAALTIDASNAGTYRGLWVPFDRATAQTVTITAAAGSGFCATLQQVGAGQLTVAIGAGLTWAKASQKTKLAEKGAVASISVRGTEATLVGELVA